VSAANLMLSPSNRERIMNAKARTKDAKTSFALGAITSYLRSRLITILGDELTVQVTTN
jgi:hypothetical protein